MATSGSVNYTQTRNEILEDALSYAGILGDEETASGVMIAKANRCLNRVVKAFENDAGHLWKKSEATLFLQYNQSEYTFGTGSTDHATESYTTTAVNGAVALGASTIIVDSNSGFVVGYYIGVIQSDGTLHWTTVSSVAGTTIGLTAVTTATCADNAVVYVYQTKINKPLNISSARRREIVAQQDLPMRKLAYKDYMDLPNKTTTGSSLLQYSTNRLINTFKFFVYPNPSTVGYIVKFTYSKSIEDFDTATDEADMPQEFLHALVLATAVQLAAMYGILNRDQLTTLKALSDEAYMKALSFDNEMTSVLIQPESY